MSRRSNCPRLQPLALSFALLSTIAVAFFLLQRGDVTSQATSLKPDDKARRTAVKESFGRLPLYFVENRGQTDSQVAYYIKGRDKTVYFTPTGLTFALSGNGDKARHDPYAAPREAESRRYALKLDFIGAREVQPVGEEKAEAIFSHFTGSKENWHSGVPSYTRVVYRELWPGIDLEYAGTVNQMKYTFHVRPGADPAQIRLGYRGASGVRVNEGGELEVSTPVETLRDERPVSHQEIDGKQVEVATSFNLDQRDEESSYGFEVGEYDPSRDLVIDPAMFIYAGYIGGNGGYELEGADGVAVDSSGNAYIVGTTDSHESSFPVTVGPDLTYNGRNNDAYVAKVNSAGTALIYCGYLGGNSSDSGSGVAVDAQGAAYVVGTTYSNETSFPDGNGFGALPGPDQTHTDSFDAFIAKISPYPNCVEGSIAPSSAIFTPEAGSGTIGVTIDSGCPWTAFSNVPWITVTSGANGSVGGTVGYSVEANTGNTTRTGTLTVAGLTFTIRQGIKAVAANAASYSTVALAPDSIAAIFGSNLATSEMAAETNSLPTSLAGTTVKVIDSANAERLAQLFYVSPRQINFLIPPGTAPGRARLLVTAGDGALALGEIMILSVSPGLFAANADAAGTAAAYVVRVKADGTQIYEQILQLDAGLGRYVARPIDLGPAGETVFLVMYGTGVRGAAPGTVRAQIGGAEAAVSYAGPQRDYVGLDQLNLTIPRSLAGRGEVEVAILADNQAANPLRIKVQ